MIFHVGAHGQSVLRVGVEGEEVVEVGGLYHKTNIAGTVELGVEKKTCYIVSIKADYSHTYKGMFIKLCHINEIAVI